MMRPLTGMTFVLEWPLMKAGVFGLRSVIRVGKLSDLLRRNALWIAILPLFAIVFSAATARAADALAQGFAAPPSAAQPRVFWWWMQTKYHKEDITRDLEEMKHVGIGGALIWDNGNGPDPAIPPGPVYMALNGEKPSNMPLRKQTAWELRSV